MQCIGISIKKKDINPRINRWVFELNSFNYIPEQRSRSKMGHVDALSRLTNEILVVEDNSFELNLVLS